jgi:hypothetical protein
MLEPSSAQFDRRSRKGSRWEDRLCNNLHEPLGQARLIRVLGRRPLLQERVPADQADLTVAVVTRPRAMPQS